MTRFTRPLTMLAFAVAFGFAASAQAQITVVNSQASGNLEESQGGGDASFTLSNYDNSAGEYLVVAVTAVSGTNSSNNALSIPSSGINVTFGDGGGGSDAFTMVAEAGQTDNRYYTSIWVLKDPYAGSADLTFDFNDDIADGVAGGAAAWQFGVVSLVNVNESAGVNNDGIIYNEVMPQSGDTITTVDAPGLTAGDFFFLSESTINSITNPNYLTQTGEAPAGSTVDFFGFESGVPSGGNRAYDVLYAELGAGDFVSGDLPISANGTTRSAAARRSLIFDSIVVPEPTSAAMMLGALGLLALRRRRS